MEASRWITTVDTHTEGQPTRIITGGIGKVPGQTMREKQRHVHQFVLDPDDPLKDGFLVDV